MHSFFSHFNLIKIKGHNCLNQIKLLVLAFLLIGLIPSSTHALESNNLEGTTLNLLGIAVHSELRNDIYIGAMFAPTGIDDFTQLYDTSITKNMSLRFIQAYSNRKIARLWKHRIAMNNEKSEWQPLTKDIVKFSKIFKRPLKSGDEINLVYVPEVGTKIYLNGSLFLIISDPQFYRILLNIWYGEVPPSKLFRTGITGKNTDYLQKEIVKQYEQLEPILGRFDKDKPKSIKNKTNTSRKPSNAKIKTKVTRAKIIPPVQPQASLAKRLVDGFKPKLQQIITKKEATTKAADRESLFVVDLDISEKNLANNPIKPIDLSQQQKTTPVIINELLEGQSQNPTSENSTNTNNSELIPTVSRISDDLVDADKPSDETNSITKVSENNIDDNESIDTTPFRDDYRREIVSIVQKNHKYPRKAQQKGHEGNLVISMTLNSSGNITSLSLLQRSGSRYLDKGVVNQIKGLEPFPPIPTSLNLELFVIEIPMSFSFAE